MRRVNCNTNWFFFNRSKFYTKYSYVSNSLLNRNRWYISTNVSVLLHNFPFIQPTHQVCWNKCFDECVTHRFIFKTLGIGVNKVVRCCFSVCVSRHGLTPLIDQVTPRRNMCPPFLHKEGKGTNMLFTFLDKLF